MSDQLKRVREAELVEPREAVTEAGATAELVSIEGGEIQAVTGDVEPTEKYGVDRVKNEATVGEYDGLLLPGAMNPDTLRMRGGVRAGSRREREAGRGDPPRSLGLGRGRCGAWAHHHLVPECRHGPAECGANWVDQEVVVVGNLISGRNPGDLPAFCAEVAARLTSRRSRPRRHETERIGHRGCRSGTSLERHVIPGPGVENPCAGAASCSEPTGNWARRWAPL